MNAKKVERSNSPLATLFSRTVKIKSWRARLFRCLASASATDIGWIPSLYTGRDTKSLFLPPHRFSKSAPFLLSRLLSYSHTNLRKNTVQILQYITNCFGQSLYALGNLVSRIQFDARPHAVQGQSLRLMLPPPQLCLACPPPY